MIERNFYVLLGIYYLVGFFLLINVRIELSNKLTISDVLFALIFAIVWPVPAFIGLVLKLDKITLWRRK